jgi:peptidoglycan/xylan/chitin deacetylase (PgdA/CDA1 family)
VPYTLDVNDSKFANPAGYSSGRDFFDYLKASFDTLLREATEEGRGAMMSVGLHMRLAGRPGRAAALREFMQYARAHAGVWVCNRIDIAQHWVATQPPGDA